MSQSYDAGVPPVERGGVWILIRGDQAYLSAGCLSCKNNEHYCQGHCDCPDCHPV